MTVTPPEFNGCPWPVDPACLVDDWDALDPDVQERSLALASATLRRLTGYRVGGCPVTVRPCKRSCATGTRLPYWTGTYGMFTPHINTAGYWVNSCGCHTDCSCTELCEVTLVGPIGEIIEVAVDGVPIDPTDYRVDRNRLVWQGDGDCPFPLCQDLTQPAGFPNTFTVEYLNSYPVDGLGAYAAGVLAVEYAKACTGKKCRLPTGVTGITRQGISMEIVSGAFPGGFTGIREVDTYLAVWNPDGLRQQAAVWSPDRPTPRVVR